MASLGRGVPGGVWSGVAVVLGNVDRYCSSTPRLPLDLHAKLKLPRIISRSRLTGIRE